MSDLIIAFSIMLSSTHKKIVPADTIQYIELPFPQLIDELTEYINSVEYRKLILKEWYERNRL